MQLNKSTLTVAALVAMASVPVTRASDLSVQEIPSFIEGRRVVALHVALADAISDTTQELSDLTKLTSEQVTMCYAHAIIRRFGDRALAEGCDKDPNLRRFLAAFLTDKDWMEQLLSYPQDYSNINVLKAMASIYAANLSSTNFDRYKPLVVALGISAVENSQGYANGTYVPTKRYALLVKLSTEGKLTLPLDNINALVHVVNSPMSDADFEYLNGHYTLPVGLYNRQNVSMPISSDPFGNSSNSRNYFQAWAENGNLVKTLLEYGAETPSNWPPMYALAAQAHGVPAYRAPGNRENYNTQITAQWGNRGQNGFTEPHLPYSKVFNNTSWSMLKVAEEVRADREGYAKALALIALAEVYATSLHNPTMANIILDTAIAQYPRNLAIYGAYLKHLAGNPHTGQVAFHNLRKRLLQEVSRKDEKAPAFYAALEHVTARIQDAPDSLFLENYATGVPSMVATQMPNIDVNRLSPESRVELLNNLFSTLYSNQRYNRNLVPFILSLAQDGKVPMADFVNTYIKAFRSKIAPNSRNNTYDELINASLSRGSDETKRRLYTLFSLDANASRSSGRTPNFEPLKGEIPEGSIISTDAWITHSPGANLWYRALSGVNTTDDVGVRPSQNSADRQTKFSIFNVSMPEARDVSGILLILTKGQRNKTAAVKVTVTVDGKERTLAKGTTTDGRFVANFPVEHTNALKVHVAFPDQITPNLSTLAIFGKVQ